MSDQILTTGEIAAELHCSKAHVYNAINGKVSGASRQPAIRMGASSSAAAQELWKRESALTYQQL